MLKGLAKGGQEARRRAGARPRARLSTSFLWLGLLAAPTFATEIRFEEVTREAGIDFRHVNGMTGERWIVEIMGAGAAAIDFDNDGRLDLWLVQGGNPFARADAPNEILCDALYHNRSEPGSIRFERISPPSVCSSGYGMAIATGDVDNDGDTDVFIANYGANAFFENLGRGRFRDATGGIDDRSWSTTATFFDKDNDGDLDLFVGNYLDFTLANHRVCRDGYGRPSYCSPEVYPASPDRLYENEQGRLTDVTSKAGLGSEYGRALGSVAADFDSNARRDIFVANDMDENLLWMNAGERLNNTALLAGAALNQDGHREAGMGVAAADFDDDCDVDLFVTHLDAQTNTLYRNDGKGWFTDVSRQLGVAAGSLSFTGFGTGWIDLENDGDLDLLIANGAVTAQRGQPDGALDLPLRQHNQLFVNDSGRYAEVRPVPGMPHDGVGRGLVLADFDNDGLIDALVTHNNDDARLYRNTSKASNWVGLIVENEYGSPAIGATVRLDACVTRDVATHGSYASANDPRIVIGLGSRRGPVSLEIGWPDGTTTTERGLTINRYHRITK